MGAQTPPRSRRDNRSLRVQRAGGGQLPAPPPEPPIKCLTTASPRQQPLLPRQTSTLLESRAPGMHGIARILRRRDPYDVFLKIYDITEGKANKYMRLLTGFHVDGIWHTAVVSHGKERFYCDGPLAMDSDAVERKFALHLIDIVYLGKTRLEEHDLDRIMHKLKSRFTPEQYDIINCNCNHFTEALLHKMERREIRQYGLCSLVCGLPLFITEQPQLFMSTLRGRTLVWLVENVLEKTDNFLNTKFAKGLDKIIQKFVSV